VDNTKIGQKLKELRGDKTQEKVAKDVGITTSALGNYEVGLRVPRDEIKKALASYYKVGVDYIFFT